jgi:hypothetical protein
MNPRLERRLQELESKSAQALFALRDIRIVWVKSKRFRSRNDSDPPPEAFEPHAPDGGKVEDTS